MLHGGLSRNYTQKSGMLAKSHCKGLLEVELESMAFSLIIFWLRYDYTRAQC